MSEIVNRVANSPLMVFDLEDYFPSKQPLAIDLSQWLHEGIILMEKPFREALKNHDWTVYSGQIVGLECLTDAVLPAWAYLLVSSYVLPQTLYVYQAPLKQVITLYYQDLLKNLDYAAYQNKAVILKGCSKKAVPTEAYVLALKNLQPVAKSVMFGEACSAVPIFKKLNH
jgi:hypothetical protein